MREITVDIGKIKTKEELHELLKNSLGFPDYYGMNLDALHDCLTDINEELEVVVFGVRNARRFSEELDSYITKLERVLEAVTEEMDNLTFILIAEDEEELEGRGKDKMGLNKIMIKMDQESIIQALKDLNVEEGDGILYSAFSGSKIKDAVQSVGATPIPIDVSSESYGVEPRLIDFAVEKYKDSPDVKLKAVFVDKPFGIPVEESLMDVIAEEAGLSLILEESPEATEAEIAYLNRVAAAYKVAFGLRFGKGSTKVWLPKLGDNVKPVWNGYPVRMAEKDKRDEVKDYLDAKGIDVTVMEGGGDFDEGSNPWESPVAKKLLDTSLVLPINGKIQAGDIVKIVDGIWECFGSPQPEEDLNPFSGIGGEGPSVRTV